jgi:hypothetical protein
MSVRPRGLASLALTLPLLFAPLAGRAVAEPGCGGCNMLVELRESAAPVHARVAAAAATTASTEAIH